MFICRLGWSIVSRSQISGPLQIQARGTVSQGRSSTDMKRGISDGIQTDGAFLCPTASPRRGSKMRIPGGCSGPLASARLGPGRSTREENNYLRYHRVICHIMHRLNLTSKIIRSTNEGRSIHPDRRVHDHPGPLICHRPLGSRDRHGEDFGFFLKVLWPLHQ